MSLINDEVYYIWNSSSDEISFGILEYYITHNPKVIFHVFLSQSKYRSVYVEKDPPCFDYHIITEESENAATGALICSVLNKFYNVAKEESLDNNKQKGSLLLIENYKNQFQELKKTLKMFRQIKRHFSIMVLTIEGSNGLVLRKFRSHENRDNAPTPVPCTSGEVKTSFLERLATIATQTHSSTNRQSTKSLAPYCMNCFRERKGQASLTDSGNEYFCLSCFLDSRIDLDSYHHENTEKNSASVKIQGKFSDYDKYKTEIKTRTVGIQCSILGTEKKDRHLIAFKKAKMHREEEGFLPPIIGMIPRHLQESRRSSFNGIPSKTIGKIEKKVRSADLPPLKQKDVSKSHREEKGIYELFKNYQKLKSI